MRSLNNHIDKIHLVLKSILVHTNAWNYINIQRHGVELILTVYMYIYHVYLFIYSISLICPVILHLYVHLPVYKLALIFPYGHAYVCIQTYTGIW